MRALKGVRILELETRSILLTARTAAISKAADRWHSVRERLMADDEAPDRDVLLPVLSGSAVLYRAMAEQLAECREMSAVGVQAMLLEIHFDSETLGRAVLAGLADLRADAAKMAGVTREIEQRVRERTPGERLTGEFASQAVRFERFQNDTTRLEEHLTSTWPLSDPILLAQSREDLKAGRLMDIDEAFGQEFDFTLVLDGPADLTEEMADALFEAGCDDATPSVRAGRVWLEFSRMAPSREEAIRSAIQDVHKAGFVAVLVPS